MTKHQKSTFCLWTFCVSFLLQSWVISPHLPLCARASNRVHATKSSVKGRRISRTVRPLTGSAPYVLAKDPQTTLSNRCASGYTSQTVPYGFIVCLRVFLNKCITLWSINPFFFFFFPMRKGLLHYGWKLFRACVCLRRLDVALRLFCSAAVFSPFVLSRLQTQLTEKKQRGLLESKREKKTKNNNNNNKKTPPQCR